MSASVSYPADAVTRADEAPVRAPLRVHPAFWLTFAAVALRLIVFTSRGDYIAFDEGWYLLLGRSVFDEAGYTLSGLRHTTLSPLFPILAGAMGALVGDIIWGGRIVAAITAGLLVWPCWHIFQRIGGRRVAAIACLLIAVMPSLTPFAAPYWIEWDLWVGAEPVLHFFLFAAFALLLRARARGNILDWVLAGACFALAYLARPEAIIPFGIAGIAVGIEGLVRRSARRIAHVLLLALAFAATAIPYWLYLHDTLGRWALSGRVVDRPARVVQTADSAGGAVRSGGAASGIERMLWEDDDRQYVRALYGLDASGTRLRSTYWGIPDATDAAPVAPLAPAPAAQLAPAPAASPVPGETASAAPAASEARREPPSRWLLYARALGTIVPWFVWAFVFIGIPRRRISREELLVALPLIVTSVAIARLVGADPRTQLFVAPLAAFYAALGVSRIGDVVETRAGSALRRGFVAGMLTLVIATGLASTVARWFYLGITMGSPHHQVGAANHAVGDAIQDIVPPGEPVMSWHPAIALYGGREWRVLPYAGFAEIVRFANAIDCEYVVLSAWYPGSKLMQGIESDHLILHVPPGAPATPDGWSIDLRNGGESHVLGVLRYSAAPDGG